MDLQVEKEDISIVPVEVSLDDIGTEINDYAQRLSGLRTAYLDAIKGVEISTSFTAVRSFEYAKKYGKLVSEDETSSKYTFSVPYQVEAHKFKKIENQGEQALKILPQVFLIALVSQYDAFLSRILKIVLSLRPELSYSGEEGSKKLGYAELKEFSSLEEIFDSLVEARVENIIRKSHLEQLELLSKIFNTKFEPDKDIQTCFIELTERRNLFAHTSGIVSTHYIKVCNHYNIILPEGIKKGDELCIDLEYYNNACDCLFQIGVELAEVIWRRQQPNELMRSDAVLNEVIVDLITLEQNQLALRLSTFACNTIKKHFNEESKRMFLINRAQIFKWLDKQEQCDSILDSNDWSACAPEYKLALAVLRDDYKKASEIMYSIGKNGDISENDYQSWPLFKKFRLTEEFAVAYKNTFGTDFVHNENLLKQTEQKVHNDMLEKLKSMLNDDSEKGDQLKSESKSLDN